MLSLTTIGVKPNRRYSETTHYGGALPERFAVAWAGYLAAMLDWGLIEISAYDRLTELLPRRESTEEDPILAIFLGRDGDVGASN